MTSATVQMFARHVQGVEAMHRNYEQVVGENRRLKAGIILVLCLLLVTVVSSAMILIWPGSGKPGPSSESRYLSAVQASSETAPSALAAGYAYCAIGRDGVDTKENDTIQSIYNSGGTIFIAVAADNSGLCDKS